VTETIYVVVEFEADAPGLVSVVAAYRVEKDAIAEATRRNETRRFTYYDVEEIELHS